MEALGRTSVRCYSGSGYGGASKNIGAPPPCSVGFPKALCRRRSASLVLGAYGGEYFRERDHLDYYYGAGMKISCGKGECCKVAKKKEKGSKQNKEMDKRRLKMMLMGQIQGGSISPEFGEEKVAQMISQDAAEAVLEQLKQLKVEGKELEMGNGEDCGMMSSESSSSSSSSESSDSESDCEETVDDMQKQKKSLNVVTVEPEKPLPQVVEALPVTNLVMDNGIVNHEFQLLGSPVEAALVSIFRGTAAADQLTHSSPMLVPTARFPTPSARKVEVCMGGKCKKSGSVALLGEFQRKLGAESGLASGCKCMGKCKVGPNVRISDDNQTGSLCIGVGLTDVDAIVANYFARSPEFDLNVV